MLFPNDSIVMILARMIGMLGPIDLEMLEQGQETDKYFTQEYDLYHINEVCFSCFPPQYVKSVYIFYLNKTLCMYNVFLALNKWTYYCIWN